MFGRLVRTPASVVASSPLRRPDRTPDSRHCALPRDPAGRGTAQPVRSVKAGKAASPGRAKPSGTRSTRASASSERTEPAVEADRGRQEPCTKLRPRDGAATTEARCPAAPRGDGRRSRSVRTTQAKRRVRARVGFHVLSPPQVGRTPGISCEAVPASDPAGAGMRRHVHPGNHAAESFVSFIPLFDGRSRSLAVGAVA